MTRKTKCLTAAVGAVFLIGFAAVFAFGDEITDLSNSQRGEEMKRRKEEHETKMQALDRAREKTQSFRRALVPPPPAETPQATWDLGIFTDAEAPLPSSEYRFTSRWVGVIGDEYVVVHAGALSSNIRQGILAIFTYSRRDTSAPSSFDVYPSPSPMGAVSIISAKGTHLELQSESGDPLSFDVLSRLFSETRDH